MTYSPSPLNTNQARTAFFERRIVLGLKLWLKHEAVKTVDVAILDQKRANILRAISLGFELDAAWAEVKELVQCFSRYMERRGNWEVWYDILHRALETAIRLNDQAGEVSLSSLLGRLSQRQSRPKQVIYHYRRAIRLARQTNDELELARACSNLGYYYIDAGHWWRSKKLCCHALTIFHALHYDHGLAHTHNHLGILFVRRQLWDLAEQHLRCACEFWQAMGDEHSLIYGFENLGMLYYEMGQPSKALTYLDQALRLVNSTGEQAEIGSIWNNMGLAYRENGDFEKAVFFANKAETVFRRYANRFNLARVWGNLGLVYQKQRKWDLAGQYFADSLAAYQTLNNYRDQATVLAHLIEIELATHNLPAAKRRLQQLTAVIDQANLPAQDFLTDAIIQFRSEQEKKTAFDHQT